MRCSCNEIDMQDKVPLQFSKVWNPKLSVRKNLFSRKETNSFEFCNICFTEMWYNIFFWICTYVHHFIVTKCNIRNFFDIEFMYLGTYSGQISYSSSQKSFKIFNDAFDLKKVINFHVYYINTSYPVCWSNSRNWKHLDKHLSIISKNKSSSHFHTYYHNVLFRKF